MLKRNLILLLSLAAVLGAAESEVTVGVAIFPPNVTESSEGADGLDGFDIELWREIAKLIELDFRHRRMPFEQLLEAVRQGEVDVGLAGITITHRREQEMDFSHPYMDSGLHILTNIEQQPALLRLLDSVSAAGVVRPISYLLGFIIFCAHILYFVERGSEAVSRKYIPGIFEAAWCILATMTTVGYGDITPHRWLGRFVSFLVMITGIGLFGVLIAQLSSGLTLEQLTSEISEPEDLRGRAVGTVAGTTSVRAANRYGARVREVEQIDQAYQLLKNRRVDAVVFDAPPLLQHVKDDQEQTVTLVGPLLNPQSYGIAFPQGSPLREPVNRALLQLKESGAYDRIYTKWFGKPPAS